MAEDKPIMMKCLGASDKCFSACSHLEPHPKSWNCSLICGSEGHKCVPVDQHPNQGELFDETF
jgi:hypothetical protein